jgi:hypothetical protein
VHFIVKGDINSNGYDSLRIGGYYSGIFGTITIISILSFGYNSLSSLKSLSVIEQANKIASRALEIALRGHKTKIIPILAIEFEDYL